MKTQKSPQEKNTHLKKMSMVHEANQKFILTELRLSVLEYRLELLENGCLFLDYIFPSNSKFERFKTHHLYSSIYWKWWQAEWVKWEREYIIFLKEHKVDITLQNWKSDMQQMINDSLVEWSFQENYQKNMNYII